MMAGGLYDARDRGMKKSRSTKMYAAIGQIIVDGNKNGSWGMRLDSTLAQLKIKQSHVAKL